MLAPVPLVRWAECTGLSHHWGCLRKGPLPQLGSLWSNQTMEQHPLLWGPGPVLGPGGLQVDHGPGYSLPSSLLLRNDGQEPFNKMLFFFQSAKSLLLSAKNLPSRTHLFIYSFTHQISIGPLGSTSSWVISTTDCWVTAEEQFAFCAQFPYL